MINKRHDLSFMLHICKLWARHRSCPHSLQTALLLGKLSLPCRVLGTFAQKAIRFLRPHNILRFHQLLLFSYSVWYFYHKLPPIIGC